MDDVYSSYHIDELRFLFKGFFAEKKQCIAEHCSSNSVNSKELGILIFKYKKCML